MWSSFSPIALLVLGCLGLGGALLHVWRRVLPDFPLWLLAAIAYFLGQGVLAAVFMVIALAGVFDYAVLAALLLSCAAPLPWRLRRSRSEWGDILRRALSGFRLAPIGWQILTLIAAGLYVYGFATVGAAPAGDAVAFYLAVSKVTVYSQELLPLPGYEDFTLVVGLYAEILVAVLMALGSPIDVARAFSWVNYLPTLVLIWGLARAVGLSGRGALLSLCVALTSSAALLLWSGGKTDLFAVGPAMAACLIALATWDPATRRGASLLTGFFCGLAVVMKLSLLVVLLPTVLLLLHWPALFDLVRSIRTRSARRTVVIVRRTAIGLGFFGLGLVVILLPHIAKNLWLGGAAFPIASASAAYYSPETTRHLVLTYPLALTYGRYWAQYGNLSPLVIAFLPLMLLLPRPKSWRDSRFAALTMSTLVGLLLWVALMPSVFMPRYILSTLLTLGILAASGAAYFSRQGAAASLSVVIATAVTLFFTPAHVNSWEPAFNWSATKRRLANPRGECLTAAHLMNYCETHQAVNAATGDIPVARGRVLVFSYYRLWLRPDVLLSASTLAEAKEIEAAADPWGLVKRRGFRVAFLDAAYPYAKALLEQLPATEGIQELYRDGELTVYEILP